MSERIKEIIDYLLDLEPGEFRDAAPLTDELEDMGYSRLEISQAFRMLDFGTDALDRAEAAEPAIRNRVLGEFEKHLLSIEAQGYLVGLCSLGVLTEAQLSFLIESASREYAPPVSRDEISELAMRLLPDLPDGSTPDALRGDGPVH